MDIDLPTWLTLLAILISTMTLLVAFAFGYGMLQAQVRETLRRQDVTNGTLREHGRVLGTHGERIAHQEGRER